MKSADSRLNRLSRERRAIVEIVPYEPEEHILRPGGKIFVALSDGVPVGVCSLINLRGVGNAEFDFELSKLAVSEEARGLGIGEKLCNAVISAARELGGRNVYLESNTVLVPAVSLYRKLGFREVSGRAVSPYERCNIRLVLEL